MLYQYNEILGPFSRNFKTDLHDINGISVVDCDFNGAEDILSQAWRGIILGPLSLEVCAFTLEETYRNIDKVLVSNRKH